jgi:hypothetical protein
VPERGKRSRSVWEDHDTSPWTFDVKFPYDTRFTFRLLTFATGEDENLKMLTPGPAPERLAPVYGQAPYFLVISSTTGSVCSGLNPYVGLHILTVKLIRGLCNIIDDQRRLRAMSSTPPRCSPAGYVTPSGRGDFHALAPSLR